MIDHFSFGTRHAGLFANALRHGPRKQSPMITARPICGLRRENRASRAGRRAGGPVFFLQRGADFCELATRSVGRTICSGGVSSAMAPMPKWCASDSDQHGTVIGARCVEPRVQGWHRELRPQKSATTRFQTVPGALDADRQRITGKWIGGEPVRVRRRDNAGLLASAVHPPLASGPQADSFERMQVASLRFGGS